MKKRIVFLGSKDTGFACLEYLLNEQSHLSFEVVAVLSNNRKGLLSNESDIKSLCSKHNILFLSELQQLFELDSFDILYSVQYHEILKEEHIQLAKGVTINLHMAPLPDYRGCNQFSYAILEGAKEFGTTIHILSEGIDSGDILFEKRWPLDSGFGIKELYIETYRASVLLFKESLPSIIKGDFIRKPQKLYSSRNKSFHLRNEIENLKIIDLSWPKEKIIRQFKATYFPPFDPPFGIINGETIPLSPEWIEKNL